MQLEEELHEYIDTLYGVDKASVYVRFNGHEMEVEGILPDPYAGLVEATQHLATSVTIPANCD